MPNIITPNGDGVNDFHTPIFENSENINYLISEIKYTVRNRWGRLIHFSEGNELPAWNGVEQRTGLDAAAGVYFWLLHYKNAAGETIKSNGFIELLR